MRVIRERRLRLRPEFAVIPLEGSSVLLRSPHQGVRVGVDGVPSSSLATLLRSMDGREVASALLEDGDAADGIASLLDGLVARDIVATTPGPLSMSAEGRLFAQFHDDPDGCVRRLAESRVVVVGSGLLAECVARDLGAAGIAEVVRMAEAEREGHAREGHDRHTECADLARACHGAALAIACSEYGGRSEYEAMVNEVARVSGLAWLSVRIFGGEGFVGPLFVPGDGPCHACLLTREEANWVDPELSRTYLQCVAKDPTNVEAYGRLPAFVSLMSQWTVLESTKWLSRFTMPTLFGRVLRVDFLACVTQLHRVFRLPRCAQCSTAVRAPGVNTLLYAQPT